MAEIKKLPVSIDETLCIKCGKCKMVCPSRIADAVCTFSSKRIEGAENFGCLKCGHCMSICPTKAFHVEGLDYENMPDVQAGWEVPAADLANHLKNVRSIRVCTEELIPDETIREMLDIAESVASAKNQHLTKWGVIKGKDKVKEFSDNIVELLQDLPQYAGFISAYKQGKNSISRECSHIFFVFAKDHVGWGLEDGTIVMEALNLIMPSYGLGSTWSGFAVMLVNDLIEAGKLKAKELVDQPEGYHLVGALIAGYPDARETYLRVPSRKPAEIAYIK